jgi:hypothetical protein
VEKRKGKRKREEDRRDIRKRKRRGYEVINFFSPPHLAHTLSLGAHSFFREEKGKKDEKGIEGDELMNIPPLHVVHTLSF